MNLRNLRTLILIADSGGIAHASDRLHLSSPAASRQILALENEFRVKLFDRIGRRLQLTSEGEDLLFHCRKLLRDAESLRDRARTLNAGQTGLIRVGAPPQVIEALFAPFISQYRRRHPGVDVHLVEDATGNLPGRIERGEITLAEMPAGDERFGARLMFPVHATVILPNAHRLARRRVIDVTDLVDEPLVLLCREFRLRHLVESAFDIARIRPMVHLESASPHTLVAVAAAGYGTAIVPSNVLIRHEGIRATPLVVRGTSIGGWSSIAWHRERFLPPYARKFVDEFVAHAQRVNPGRDVIRRAPRIAKPKEADTK
jgi:LysR family transcriptional regulator, cyn operon transcriptional activator